MKESYHVNMDTAKHLVKKVEGVNSSYVLEKIAYKIVGLF